MPAGRVSAEMASQSSGSSTNDGSSKLGERTATGSVPPPRPGGVRYTVTLPVAPGGTAATPGTTGGGTSVMVSSPPGASAKYESRPSSPDAVSASTVSSG